MLKVYFADVSPLNDDALYARALARLSPYRRAKAERFVFRRDRNLSAGAGLLLDHALREFGLREAEARYAEGEHGKPFLADRPGLCFNLSHSGERVMAVICDREAGCDVERTAPADLALARRVFREEEYRLVAGPAAPEERAEAFFRLWTLKESYLKATGLGLSLSPDAFGIGFAAGCPVLLPPFDGEGFSFAEIPIPGGYRGAVCVRGDCVPEKICRVEMGE